MTLTVHTDYDLTDLDPALGEFVQVTVTGASKGRQLLATNEMVTLKADTAVKGGGTNGGCGPKSACPALTNTGVPFSYVDRTPKNGFRYFYSVTAFDVNSFESGPSSLESPRNTKSTTPVRPAGNYVNTADLSLHVVGRGVAMDTIITADPTINATTGVFSGPQRPANGLIPGFVGQLAKQVLNGSGAFEVRLDSISSTRSRVTSPAAAAVSTPVRPGDLLLHRPVRCPHQSHRGPHHTGRQRQREPGRRGSVLQRHERRCDGFQAVRRG